MSQDNKLSKLLSFWLRHKPDDGNLSINPTGWVEIDDVLTAFSSKGYNVSWENLGQLVACSDKKRFEISIDGRLIRARQGHSIPVNLDWPISKPPEFLFHGTVERFLASILSEGLKPMGRHHVHLSTDVETASAVGSRRGEPVLLQISSAAMCATGIDFRLSGNGVWLVNHVPPQYITRLHGS